MFVLNAQAQMWVGVVLTVYLLSLLGLSYYASTKVKNVEDFLVAGRRLPLFMSWGTLVATWFGATISGNCDNARDGGLREVILDPFACSATLVIAGLFFARPLWRMQLVTMGDFYRRKFGPAAELTACAIQVPSYFFWIAAQYVALAGLQKALFGIPTHYGIIIGVSIALAYTVIGGMWSVTLTDTVQIVIALFGLTTLIYAIFGDLGGGSAIAGVQRLINETPPARFSLWPHNSTAMTLLWAGVWATGLFGNIPGQDLQQRVFSARSESVASWACILGGLTYLFIGMVPVLIGLASNITDPHMFEGVPEDQRGDTLHRMAGKYLSPLMLAIYAVSYVSIVMSCAVAVQLSPATVLANNILRRFAFFRRGGLMLDRGCVVFMCVASTFIAFGGKSIVELLNDQLSVAFVALFVPLLMGVYGKPRSEWSGVFAMVFGAGFWFIRWAFQEWVVPGYPDEMHTAGEPFSLYVASHQSFEAYPGFVRTLLSWYAVTPAVGYGVTASFAGYFIGQRLGPVIAHSPEGRLGVSEAPATVVPQPVVPTAL